jgi:hypothetical protein
MEISGQSQSSSSASRVEKTLDVMYLRRKSLLPLAFVVGLFGTPMLGPAHVSGAPGGVVRPPVGPLAAANPGIRRRRRRVRGGKVRGILSRAVGRLGSAGGRTRPAGERIVSRRALHDRLARGPPRSHAL